MNTDDAAGDRPEFAALPRRGLWSHRLTAPATLEMPLGFGLELWEPEIELLGFVELATAWYNSIGGWPKGELVGALLPEVVHAASVVEYTHEKMTAAAAEVDTFVREHNLKPHPSGVPTGLTHPAVWRLYVELENMVIWIRALSDRLDHTFEGGRCGLVPAIKRGTPLRGRAERLTVAFASAAAETRQLTNLSLHSQRWSAQGGSSSVRLGEAGIEPNFPDLSVARVRHPAELTWERRRNALDVADGLLNATRDLVDGLLDAFEDEAPARFARIPRRWSVAPE